MTDLPLGGTVGLVRHGQADWTEQGRIIGQADRPLTEAGRAQIRILASRLLDDGWVRIISSPLVRASDSAEIINERLQLATVELDDRLVERGYGVAEGTTISIAKALYPIEGGAPGSERSADFAARVNSIVGDIMLAQNKKILVITHAAVIAQVCQVFKAEPRYIATGSITYL